MTFDSAAPHGWFGNFGQISFGVTDLRRAIDFWERQAGVGPWTIYEGLVMDAVHEGQRIAMPFSIAIAWHEGRLMELIRAEGDGPSPLHDGLNRATVGLQRLASVTDQIERDAEIAAARGMKLITAGEAAGQRFFHYRSDEAPGLILELLERTPAFDRLVEELRARALAWHAPAPTAHATASPPESAPRPMKVALLQDYGGPEQFIVEDAIAPAPGEGEVRIRVAAAAINPVDIKARRGLLREWQELAFPARLGGDIAGTVDAVGPGVTTYRVGDRVAAMLNPFADGGYAQYVTVQASALARVPDALDLTAAAALPTGSLAGTALIEQGVRPKVGERVLVLGAGGSAGRAALLALLAAGATPIAGVRAAGRELVHDLGVEILELDDAIAIAAMTSVDAIADTVGGQLAESLFDKVRPTGTVASIAVPAPVPPTGSTQRLCNVVARFDAERLARIMTDAATSGRAVPIGGRYSLDQIADAHRAMEAGSTRGKILLLP